ncbi:hypothetical protein BGZ75_002676 [Mortierella antarctica]|nr:hypothetical protein BGZ75_002676 [Mortierella antarctica]
MHISQAPAECIRHILLYLDLSDQHSLLLTCNALFRTVAPALYRSPFRALLAHDYGQRRVAATAAAWRLQDDTRPIATKKDSWNESSNPHTNASTSLNSSTPSTSSTTLSSIRTTSPTGTATSKPAHHSRNSSQTPRRTRFYSYHKSSSLDQHSCEGGVETFECRELFKLKKMARLLQLLIACTSVQVRLPALQYPGYGQQWVRPPCKIDYLQYYVDQQQGGEIMVQCFHLLFADLAQSPSEKPKKMTLQGLTANIGGVGGSPITSDNKTLDVLHRIQREFVSHNAARIQTLSLSLLDVPSLQDALSLVPQMAMLTRLELTDFENQNLLGAEIIVDFIISHRMLFGPVLRENILVARGSSALTAPTSSATATTTSTTTTTIATTKADEQLLSTRGLTEPFSPTSRMFTTSLTKRPVLNKSILTMVEAFKDIEEIDATQWAQGVLYLDRIAHPRLKKLWLSYTFPPSEPADSKAARLSEYLERCRALEQIHIPIRRADVFHWAALEKRSALICAPILASSKAKKLPPMKRIHLQGPTLELMDCVREATFAFQDTLQELEAYSRLPVWQPSALEWTAEMPQLTRLKLEGEIRTVVGNDSGTGMGVETTATSTTTTTTTTTTTAAAAAAAAVISVAEKGDAAGSRIKSTTLYTIQRDAHAFNSAATTVLEPGGCLAVTGCGSAACCGSMFADEGSATGSGHRNEYWGSTACDREYETAREA